MIHFLTTTSRHPVKSGSNVISKVNFEFEFNLTEQCESTTPFILFWESQSKHYWYSCSYVRWCFCHFLLVRVVVVVVLFIIHTNFHKYFAIGDKKNWHSKYDRYNNNKDCAVGFLLLFQHFTPIFHLYYVFSDTITVLISNHVNLPPQRWVSSSIE